MRGTGSINSVQTLALNERQVTSLELVVILLLEKDPLVYVE